MNYKNFRQSVKNEVKKIDIDSEVILKDFSHFIKWSLAKEKTPAETSKEILSESLKRYDVFIRTWFIYDDSHNYMVGNSVKKIIAGPGEKTYIPEAQGLTRAEARAFCEQWNDEHEPGELSLKAEFEES